MGRRDELPAGEGDDDEEDDDHESRMVHHPADKAHVRVLHRLIDPVEAAVEPVRLLLLPGSEPEGALGGFEGHGIDGADHGGGGDDQGKLAEDLSGDAGQKGGRQKDGDQGHGDAHDRPVSSLMALMAASFGESPFRYNRSCSPR